MEFARPGSRRATLIVLVLAWVVLVVLAVGTGVEATERELGSRAEVALAEASLSVDSVVMDHCRIGPDARIHRGIVDRYNYIQPGETIAAGEATQREGSRTVDDLIAIRRGRTRPL